MTEDSRFGRLDQPRESRRLSWPGKGVDQERFGIIAEAFARWMGTAQFLFYMTCFVTAWLMWNTLMPEPFQFDPRSLNYTLLTLILSLQASYAAPLILLAQNRQDDRDRVGLEQDRGRDERNLADTEYLTREVAALRIAMRDVATRDYVRSELRELLDELREDLRSDDRPADQGAAPAKPKRKKRRSTDTSAIPVIQEHGAATERASKPKASDTTADHPTDNPPATKGPGQPS
ncbi:putative membrane protein [Kineosphaera limosa]|uniref:DUF1003 domain-containing protein n=1 Tax=Kineosphaera limosa NBRC 100340 TaxID=1184609 RepID=K6W9X4_9MICO|nr:DUF1003 domain-containing protein [Kineosphaera limosa]NYE02470.1 putative membrane protein [Kineosphaera limosa]GAB96005.1 hypothetical protein KILIM_030_00480 [Kineosphaera limosa NBRC 100340]